MLVKNSTNITANSTSYATPSDYEDFVSVTEL